ncbi:MAG TPA: 3-oxoacyl-ACP reductase family protein [Polyangia bacterium]|nr:3-oxoacyl-ACP reductase family protein [Polyangia bacterium]
MISLKGRVALVTGGSRGIGRASALTLARAGADVAISYAHADAAAEETVQDLRACGVRAAAVRADLVTWQAAEHLARRTAELLGPPGILVANHGVWEPAAIDAMSEDDYDRTLDTNLKGVFAVCRFVVPAMKQAGWGRVILVASTAGQRGEPGHSHYAASKGAIIALTKSLAPELAPSGILVNCVAPGWVATDLARPALEDEARRRQILATIPLGRVALPDEIAAAVLFLASDLSTFVCGEILNVNGGAVLCG